jgi:hypothetical protein
MVSPRRSAACYEERDLHAPTPDAGGLTPGGRPSFRLGVFLATTSPRAAMRHTPAITVTRAAHPTTTPISTIPPPDVIDRRTICRTCSPSSAISAGLSNRNSTPAICFTYVSRLPPFAVRSSPEQRRRATISLGAAYPLPSPSRGPSSCGGACSDVLEPRLLREHPKLANPSLQFFDVLSFFG